MHMPKLLLAVLLAVAASSCAALTSEQLVPRPSQEVALSGPEVCRLYIARAAQTRGALRPVRVIEDEREIGVIRAGDYLCWERQPGQRILRLIFEGRTIDSGAVETVVASDGVAGEVLYFQIGLGVGAGEPDRVDNRDKPFVTMLSAEDGRALIADRSPAPLK